MPLQQRICVISAIIFLLMPLIALFSFIALDNIPLVMLSFIAMFFSYTAWLFSANSIHGKIPDRSKKKYETIRIVSKVCVTVFPLTLPLSVAICYFADIWMRTCGIFAWGIVFWGIAVFCLLQYIEVCCTVYDIFMIKNAISKQNSN